MGINSMFSRLQASQKEYQSKMKKEMEIPASTKEEVIDSNEKSKSHQPEVLVNKSVNATKEEEAIKNSGKDMDEKNNIMDKQYKILKSVPNAEVVLEPANVTARVQRVVACAKVNKIIIGLIGSEKKVTSFTWRFETEMFPKINGEMVEGKQGSILRALIQKRFGMDNIEFNPMMPAKKNIIKYKTFKSSNVTFNMFDNGYIRGTCNGTPFVWNILKYKNVNKVSKIGYGGKLLGADHNISNKILKILHLNGINSEKTYLEFINSNKKFITSKIEKCFSASEVAGITLARKVNEIVKQNGKLDRSNSEHVSAYKRLVKLGYSFDKDANKIINSRLSKKWSEYNKRVDSAA